MEKTELKKFIECYLPMTKCNMRCEYCYIYGHNNAQEPFCDLSQMKQKAKQAFSLERLGGVCLFNFCAAGETMLHPDLAEIVREILECGHFAMIVTNGTLTERIKEYCSFDEEQKKRLFFKISFHYLELRRLKLMDRFFDNIELVKNSGISYTVELTPDDSYIPYIDEIKEICNDKLGALCHVTVPRDERVPGHPLMTKLSREEFRNTWKTFDSALFDFKESIFEVPRKEFCYAGKWSIVLNMSSGDYYQCYIGNYLGNIFKDVENPLNLLPIGNNCPEGHCFNGHAFLGFGLIPEIKSPTFAEMRNRKTASGENWIGSDMLSIMESRLEYANEQYNSIQKFNANIKNDYLKLRKYSGKIKRRLSGEN